MYLSAPVAQPVVTYSLTLCNELVLRDIFVSAMQDLEEIWQPRSIWFRNTLALWNFTVHRLNYSVVCQPSAAAEDQMLQCAAWSARSGAHRFACWGVVMVHVHMRLLELCKLLIHRLDDVTSIRQHVASIRSAVQFVPKHNWDNCLSKLPWSPCSTHL